jgi:imidazolonepropionase-like amidohydrolase
VKSPFGAATSWSAHRIEDEAKAPDGLVQLGGPEADAGKAEPPRDLPTELPIDRLHRSSGEARLIRNGTILTATGKTLPNASLLIIDGRIAGIGPEEELVADVPADALRPGEPLIIDATNRYVIPGLIDTHSHIMIGSSPGLGGVNEFTDSIVCEVRIKDVINTADPAEYRALAAGVTTARLLHGSANVIGGQDAVVQLKHGRTAAEHILWDAPQGVKFALGENVKARPGRFPNTRLGVEATLQRAFVEALEYRKEWRDFRKKCETVGAEGAGVPPRRDLRLEALAAIVDQQLFIHSHCYRADEILMLLRVADQHGIRVRSLQHVLEGYKVAPEIVAHGASCSTFADWWAYKVEAFDATPHNAALLHEAGANTVIKSDNDELMRHLPLEAAKTIRYGSMPPDAALQTVTLNPAKELGLADRIGSIEAGKQADLAIFNGHPFSPFSRCEMTIIDGRVEFVRERQPTAMSDEAARRTAVAPPLLLPHRAPETQTQFLAASQLLERAEKPRYALVGATLHPVDGPDIPNGTLLVDHGRIEALGEGLSVPEGCPTIALDGLHVYPGLIDAGTTLGLVEIGRVRETHDYAEGGQFQPDLRAGVAINPDSELIPVARAGGVTTIHVRPVGGIIAGQTSVAQLAGWTVPDMLLVPAGSLQINWPSGGDRQKSIDDLRQFLKEARIYDRVRAAQEASPGDASVPAVTIDPRYEALRPYVRGEKRVHVEADSRQQILEAVQFAKEESLNVVITGGTDAWKEAALLRERGVPVIVGPTMRHPMEAYDPFDAPYANPGRLWEAGVKFCIRSNNASNSRNAPFEAAIAVAYGLPESEALKAVTLSSAEILGVADKLGSLTPGKRADLIITDGSPLWITTQVRGVIIGGRPFAPESRQTRLAEKYRRRLTNGSTPAN